LGLPGKAGGAVAVRRTLASTICRIADPTLVARPRQLRDASTVMRFRPAHQSMINRRFNDRASCPARKSPKQALARKPPIHLPATWKGGHESVETQTDDSLVVFGRAWPEGLQATDLIRGHPRTAAGVLPASVDTRHKATAVRFSILSQPRAGAGNDRLNQCSPWPDLVRPPTSWREAVWTAGKPWMTGTSPVKGTWSYSRVSANN